ncbi:MAG: type II secretion system protein GspG [Planctomycetota bacterium]
MPTKTCSSVPPRSRVSGRGFSLLELTLVIAIIGVLMGIAAINVVGAGERAKKKSTVTSMSTIDSALKAYRLEYNSYPETLGLLVDFQFLDAPVPRDGWDKEFYYTLLAEGKQYSLISYGGDGLPNTDDDLDAAYELTQ